MPERAHGGSPLPHGRGAIWGVLLGRRASPAGPDSSPESLGERVVRLAPPATLLGLLISLLVHLLALLIAALIAIGGAQAGGAGAAAPAVELAVVTDTELAAMQNAALELVAPPVPESPTPELPPVEMLDTQVGDDVSGLLDASAAVEMSAGAGDITGSSSLGVSGAGGGAASFFGAEARGTRFAYVVDVSGSMGYDNKIETLKRELARSVDALLENAHFFIVAFSTDATPLGGKREWTEASDSGKTWGRRAIATLGANGGTNPSPAFAIIFALRPKPDAIYFMTDGLFDESVALELLRLNAEWRIPIHCISFVSKEAEALMRRIAADSGGTYTHVPGAGR